MRIFVFDWASGKREKKRSVKCQLGTGQKFRATFCSQIQTVYSASSRRPPKIKSRNFLKLQPLPPLRNKNLNFQWFPINRWPLDSASLVFRNLWLTPKSLRSFNLFLWSPWPRQSPISFLSKMIASHEFFFSHFFQKLDKSSLKWREKNHNNKKKRSKFFFRFWPREMRESWNFFRLCFLLHG